VPNAEKEVDCSVNLHVYTYAISDHTKCLRKIILSMEFFICCKGKLAKHLNLNPGYLGNFQKV
jgi:hypothetical protein